MKINLKATKIEITEAISRYAQQKFDAMDKYLGNTKVINCDVELKRIVGGQNKGDVFSVEANLTVPHELLRVEKTEDDLYKAIDKVRDHLDEIIIKYREKARDKRRGK